MTGVRQDPDPSPNPPDPASSLWDAAFVVVGILSFAGLFLLGRGIAFGSDPWPLVAGSGEWSIDALLRPYDAQWLLGPNLVHRVLLDTFGLDTYRPYLALFLLLHVATATALYAYARPRSGRVIAFGIGVVFLLLGSAGDVYFVAPLIGWAGATTAGAWALVILLGPLPIRWAPVAAALLLVAVAMSTVGLFFLAATIVALLPGPRRRYLWVVALAGAAYALWFMSFVSAGQGAAPGLGAVVEFTRVGVAFSVGQVSGLGSELGLVLAVLLGLATIATMVLSSSMRLGLMAGFVGLTTQYIVVSLAQGQAGVEAALTPAHVYPAAVFIFIALASWLAHRPLDVAGQRLRLVAVVAILVSIAVAGQW